MDDWLLFGYVFKRAIRMPPHFLSKYLTVVESQRQIIDMR